MNPTHSTSILTAGKFVSEEQIIRLANACNKMVKKPDGEYMVSPFHQIEIDREEEKVPNLDDEANLSAGEDRGQSEIEELRTRVEHLEDSVSTIGLAIKGLQELVMDMTMA